jgi:hypothetical protein
MNAKRVFWAGLLISLVTAPLSAFAARNARIDADVAEVREGPGAGYNASFKLKKGSPVVVSNVPTEGYYKARTANGMIGWIAAEALIVAEAEPETPSPDADEPKKKEPPKKKLLDPDEDPFTAARRKGRHVQVRGFGGMNFYNSADANALLKFDGLKNGYGYGGELGIRLYKDFWLVGRGERLFKALTGSDTKTNASYKFSFDSIPLTGGFQLGLFDEDGITGAMVLLGGMGTKTQLSCTDAAGNVVVLGGGNYLTGIAKLNIGFELSRVFGIFAEAGYRYLKTPAVIPGVDNDAGTIFKSNGSFVPISLDMSGFMASGGVAITF